MICAPRACLPACLPACLQSGRIKGEQKKALRALIERYELPVTLTPHQVRPLISSTGCAPLQSYLAVPLAPRPAPAFLVPLTLSEAPQR